MATQFDTAAVIGIETRRQYVAKASAILDQFGSPFWDVPDDPIRSDPPERRVPLRGSAGSTGSIRPMECGPTLSKYREFDDLIFVHT